ncbi:MAG TPA: YslB family protein [Ureibacillus sp.]|nr:YslB family protein [Ureibacillus sp.]
MTSQGKTIPVFGYEILRDYVLPSILGKHEDDVLYWVGKDIARKFPCSDIQLIVSFFEDAGWGELSLEKEMKDGYIFQLKNEPDLFNIEKRKFRLEAGFIAEQIQVFKGYLTECYDEKKEKSNIVQFTVKWDVKEKIS